MKLEQKQSHRAHDRKSFHLCGLLSLAWMWVENKASPIFKKDGWSPLLWAACNGNEAIVRSLLRHQAHSEYVDKPADDDQNEDENGQKIEADPFKKTPDAKKIGKYTPLHWASYKGHYKVVWLLLKAGMSPLS